MVARELVVVRESVLAAESVVACVVMCDGCEVRPSPVAESGKTKSQLLKHCLCMIFLISFIHQKYIQY